MWQHWRQSLMSTTALFSYCFVVAVEHHKSHQACKNPIPKILKRYPHADPSMHIISALCKTGAELEAKFKPSSLHDTD